MRWLMLHDTPTYTMSVKKNVLFSFKSGEQYRKRDLRNPTDKAKETQTENQLVLSL